MIKLLIILWVVKSSLSINVVKLSSYLDKCKEFNEQQVNGLDCDELAAQQTAQKREMNKLLDKSQNICCSCSDNESFHQSLTSTTIISNESIYVINSQALDWLKANDYCESLGGELIGNGISTIAERRFLFANLNVRRDYIWIGLSDEDEEGVWRWSNGSALTNSAHFGWKSGQPNGGRRENCALMYTVTNENGGGNDQYKVFDFACLHSRKYPSVCEFNLRAFMSIYGPIY